jgi:hypothetical protein
MSTKSKAARRGATNPKYHEKRDVARDSTLSKIWIARVSMRKKRHEKTRVRNTHQTASYRTRRKGLKIRIFAATRRQSRYSVYDLLVATTTDERHARPFGRPLRDGRGLMIPASFTGNDKGSWCRSFSPSTQIWGCSGWRVRSMVLCAVTAHVAMEGPVQVGRPASILHCSEDIIHPRM